MKLITLAVQWDFALSLSIIGYLIVLLALMFLFFIYTLIPRVIQAVTNTHLRRKNRNGDDDDSINIPDSGEIGAAISAALYLYLNEQHDDESGKMTIKEVSKKYSPWSSKIYGVRQPLNR